MEEQEGGYAGEIILEATWVGSNFFWEGGGFGKQFESFPGGVAMATYFRLLFGDVTRRFKVGDEGSYSVRSLQQADEMLGSKGTVNSSNTILN